ncbi:MAG: VWA domain-containing protein [Planctomycetota bacterium]|nr:VWA domain-containing protein [Planctomycetota bacterium]
MRRVTIGLLALAATALAGGLKLKDLFDPGHPRFSLSHYSWQDWEKLSRKEKMRAKGIDPATWVDPPPDPPDPNAKPKPKKKKPLGGVPGRKQYPKDRWPGFRFDQRLKRKQQAFEKLVGDNPAPSVVEGLIKQLGLIEKSARKFEKNVAEATEMYVKVKERVDKATETYARNYKKRHGKNPSQVLLPRALLQDFWRKSKYLQEGVSVQQSERMFHEWVLARVGGYFAALTESEQQKPLAALAKGLVDKDWRKRIRSAAVLGHAGSKPAVDLFTKALQQEQDPLVLGELIRIRAKRSGKGLAEVLAERIDDESWPVRLAVIRALARIRTKESIDLLVARMAKEPGRLKDDIRAALHRLTGKTMDPDPEPWKLWWEKNREKWTPPPVVAGVVAAGGAKGEGVYFYGIRTSSRRIVFCIDISGSMEFPLDGEGGKRAPRIERAKKELYQAMAALRDEAQFAIVVYNSEVGVWKRGRMMPAVIKNKQAGRKFVEKLQPAGSTNIFDALNKSLDIARSPVGKRDKNPSADTIFFLTDGVPTHGKIVDPLQIIEEITARNKLLGVTIHTIGVSKDQNAGFLLNLAKRNGGQYVAHK